MTVTVEDVLQSIASSRELGVVTNYILVMEAMSPEGDLSLTTMVTPTMSPWLYKGLLEEIKDAHHADEGRT